MVYFDFDPFVSVADTAMSSRCDQCTLFDSRGEAHPGLRDSKYLWLLMQDSIPQHQCNLVRRRKIARNLKRSQSTHSRWRSAPKLMNLTFRRSFV